MKIIADSPTLYSPEEGEAIGVTIIPSCTIMDDTVYRDYEDMSFDEIMHRIQNGAVPTTSQPSIGDIMDVFEETDEEILVLPIGDGLSGTYQNMEGARNLVENKERIHILDTKTLAGPQRYLLQKAVKLREDGLDITTIKNRLKECIETSVSYVIPEDFDFLKRSGRLTPIAAKISSVIRIVPVMTQTEDKRKITILTIKRSRKKAVAAIIEHMKSLGVNDGYRISVAHGGVIETAKEVLEQIREQFARAEMKLYALAPSLVTHGGPGCVVIQAIRK